MKVARIVALVAGCSALADARVSADAPAPTSLYDGEPMASAASTIGPWGGGLVSDTDQANFADGKKSLLVTTDGPYQGALLTCDPAIAVGDISNDETRYLTIAIAQAPAGPPQPMSAPKPKSKNALPDVIGSAYPRSLLHFAQMQMPMPMPGGPMGPGQMPPDQNGQPQVQASPPAPAISFVRAVITTSSGATSECVRAVPLPFPNSGWSMISFPLTDFVLPAAERSNLKIKSVMLAGDAPAKFFLGYVHVATDTQPIVATIQGDADVAPGSQANWSFLLNSGVSNVRWEWKVDDGSPVEHGQTLTHTFTKGGVYHVTLTVFDIDKIKAPCTATMKVTVQNQ